MKARQPEKSGLSRSCTRLVGMCADLKAGEPALIVSDGETEWIGKLIAEAASQVTDDVTHLVVDGFAMHGHEPPAHVGVAMSASKVIFGVTRMSMAHTNARRIATELGARYLSLPDYSEEVLLRPAPSVLP